MQTVHPARGMHCSRPDSARRIDPTRILGYAGAIALNACVLALLLAPLQSPPDAPATQRTHVTELVPVRPPRIVVPVAAPKPRPVQPTQVATPTRPVPIETPAPVVVEDGVLPMTVELPAIAPNEAVAATPAITPDPGPAAMRLEYASATPPPYPRSELRAGNEGTVVLQVLVDVDGRPLEVLVAESSGHRALDAAARRHVMSAWLFRPAMQDGRPVQAIGLVPVAFSLD